MNSLLVKLIPVESIRNLIFLLLVFVCMDVRSEKFIDWQEHEKYISRVPIDCKERRQCLSACIDWVNKGEILMLFHIPISSVFDSKKSQQEALKECRHSCLTQINCLPI